MDPYRIVLRAIFRWASAVLPAALETVAPVVDFLFCLVLRVAILGLELAFELLAIAIDARDAGEPQHAASNLLTGYCVGAELFAVVPLRSPIRRHSGAAFRLSLVALRETVVLLSLRLCDAQRHEVDRDLVLTDLEKPANANHHGGDLSILAGITSLILPIDWLALFSAVVPISLLARISLPC